MITIQTKPCLWCHVSGEVTLTEDQHERLAEWMLGDMNIQDVLPDLSADVREQIMTGIHPDCWNQMWAEGEVD